ncbi:MAG: hypothetical protein K5894_07550 [Lachnospiraceae bacterium]|nr:hypothetical protein [Lachnospiraceae bacterium]
MIYRPGYSYANSPAFRPPVFKLYSFFHEADEGLTIPIKYYPKINIFKYE